MFDPILGKDLKLSAEDIEIGLVKPDVSLARLHIKLLKVYFLWLLKMLVYVRKKTFFTSKLLINVWMNRIEIGSTRETLCKCRNVAILVFLCVSSLSSGM